MKSVDEAVALERYDRSWPRQYDEHVAWLCEAVGEDVIAAEHIGSTAVPGMAAKPIVDIMIGVADAGAGERVAAKLVSLGYEDCGGATGRRYLRRRHGPSFNVQIIDHESEMWRANVVLRDYLRADADAASRYEDAKRAAAERAPMLLAYSKLKDAIIQELLDEASGAG